MAESTNHNGDAGQIGFIDDVPSEYLGAVAHLDDANRTRQMAEIDSIHANTNSRTLMVWVIAIIFIGLNDVAQMAAKPPLIKPEDRLITTETVMSLIGATVVQVGGAVIAIVAYLFPKRA